jgi:putative oxygen-independent coproporphyrinogen III oxidase
MRVTCGRPIGVYVHFPWCVSKCPYCDFFSVELRTPLDHEAYANAVIAEFERRYASIETSQLHSIYFGGGTPSLWDARQLGRVIAHVLERFQARACDTEITVECNPSSFDSEKCRSWKHYGVNRLSLGLQSLNDADLKYLGRAHDASSAIAALRAALDSDIDRVCADLMFGLPNRTANHYLHELQQLPLDDISHISAYALTVEKNTPFGALARQGKLDIAPDETAIDTFVALHEKLQARGFEHYEVSNYAKPGLRSVHNSAYWKGLDYLGLGAAAWGTVTLHTDGDRANRRIRYRNTTQISRYVQMAH